MDIMPRHVSNKRFLYLQYFNVAHANCANFAGNYCDIKKKSEMCESNEMCIKFCEFVVMHSAKFREQWSRAVSEKENEIK